ncbi:S41 family peptidase [Psychroserpens sp. AS72]|uniref:S41 family peptidase n=1 Tax=Psychroserpens sp. AS72 TaxID=3135775 RepID=UPI00316E9EA0
MNVFKISLLLILTLSMTSCFEDRDDNAIAASEINDFVWKGMNAVYLYKDDVPDLANDRFTTNEQYGNYLSGFTAPENLFESLIYQRATVDRFSVIVDDYIALEQQFNGISTSNGMEFGLFRFNETDTELYGYVQYVMPNTSAETQGVTRGDIFYGVDGVQLTVDNYINLLFSSNSSYTINIGNYDDNGTNDDPNDDSVLETTNSIELTKQPYTENPILISNVLNLNANTVGYLMYNGFTGTDAFDSQLNAVFADFNAAGVTDLVIDLRYNGGGSVNTAIWLSSMITGQFTGDLLVSEQWNSELQAQIENNNPQSLLNPFVDEMRKFNTDGDVVFQESINHLNLNKVYILTTRGTASASELVINGLNPYIDVIQIGSTSRGKYQASITIYDSPNLGRADANPNHTYAMQPLIFKTVNSVGFTDFDSGLVPNIIVNENFGNLGVLGSVDEPLLAAAIADIEGTGRISNQNNYDIKSFKSSKDFKQFSTDMYIDTNTTILNRLELK